ncbi:phage recombination protein Bet [Thermodesulfitimonas autotrophica]|uniref:Phage recombination protein Bet n=1 Tax=Thermodesulfitimonas autotrophica TaxID=1894989 RepID=A0A3N5BIK8_9THEO|nr:phage recombination protein Bet [Thermodesulfitimonas autotrophica]RPF49508.1 phage recombination protein Bet [Thermodesulfitimonas autotrophica]
MTKATEKTDLWFGLTPEQVDLLKKLYPTAPEAQLRLFVYQAKRAGLDPLTNQIHLLERRKWNKETGQWEVTWSVQTGIDGFRAVADRTGCYAPGRAPEIVERDGKIFAATAYVMKRVGDRWFEVSATAYFDEYVQTDSKGQPLHMWRKMPRNQLAKCAEALALRKAFPAELSGIYTDDEMQQADSESVLHAYPPEPESAPVTSQEPAGAQPEAVQATEQKTEGPQATGNQKTIKQAEAGKEKAKKSQANLQPFEGQVTVIGTPILGEKGWEVKAALGDEAITLVGDLVKDLTEAVYRVKGQRAKNRVKVGEIKPVGAQAQAETQDNQAIAAVIRTAPKKTVRSKNGAAEEVVWCRAEVEGHAEADGYNVQVILTGDALLGLNEGQTVTLIASPTGEKAANGEDIYQVREVCADTSAA